jgi:hypothetical protein
VWVNPAHPAESVVDRTLRVGPLALNLVIAGFAGGSGLLILMMVVGARMRGRRGRKKQVGTGGDAP